MMRRFAGMFRAEEFVREKIKELREEIMLRRS